MDVDLYERSGLAGCTGCAVDAEALQFHEADDVGLRGLQPAKQIVHCGGAYRGFPMILDRYFVVERHRGKSRRLSNLIDPFVARNRVDPRPEGSRWCVGVPFGMYC